MRRSEWVDVRPRRVLDDDAGEMLRSLSVTLRMTLAHGAKLGGAAVLFVTTLGVGCEDGERSAAQAGERSPARAYCEVDTLTGRPIECCRLCPFILDMEEPDCDVPASQFGDISAVWEEWQSHCGSTSVSSGLCSNGMSYIVWSSGLGAEWRYFDESGAFVALETLVDVIVEPCDRTWYWPKVVECDPVSGQTLCERRVESL